MSLWSKNKRGILNVIDSRSNSNLSANRLNMTRDIYLREESVVDPVIIPMCQFSSFTPANSTWSRSRGPTCKLIRSACEVLVAKNTKGEQWTY